MINAIFAARTFFKNFRELGALPIVMTMAIAAFAVGGFGAWKLRGWINAAEIARANNAVLAIRADIAGQAAEQERIARELQQAHHEALQQRDALINARLNEFPIVLRQTLKVEFAKLRETIDAPRFNCLRTEPLPDDFLDGLRREGGQVRPEGH